MDVERIGMSEKMEQLRALERVCDQRHLRGILAGRSEKEAATLVAAFLTDWISRHATYSDYKREYAEALRQGYSA
jgi:hypothetical protein